MACGDAVENRRMTPHDRIILKNLVFRGYHGVHPAERELGQRFEVDVELVLDLSRPMLSDVLQDTADYGRAFAIVREEVEQRQYQLLEALAGTIVQRILAELPVTAARVQIRKPHVPLDGALSYVAVEIQRQKA
jgi:dihydroneopterin aldolase